jgi:hypothetical protein
LTRTLILGDVHGMLKELDALLDSLAPTSEDRLISIGDLIHKGPDSVGVLRRAREVGMELVLGNHEHQQHRFRSTLRTLRSRFPGKPDSELLSMVRMPKATALYEMEQQFTDEDVAFLESARLYLPIPGGVAIHGGIPPAFDRFPTDAEMDAERTARKNIDTLCRTRFVRGRREVQLTVEFQTIEGFAEGIDPGNSRTAEPEPGTALSFDELAALIDRGHGARVVGKVIREKGRPLALGTEGPHDPFWADVYDGRFGTAYFGHQPYLEAESPVEFPHAVGLDLGAVFGNRLAAVVIEPDGNRRFVIVRSSGKFARSMWED